MSSLFNDPTFEKMKNDEDQWLNLAIQPFEFDILDKIRELPEEFQLDEDAVKSLMRPSPYSIKEITINVSQVLDTLVHAMQFAKHSEIRLAKLIIENSELYKIKIIGDIVDLELDIYPEIHVIKNKDLDEADIFKYLATTVNIHYINARDTSISRLNSVLDTFDVSGRERQSKSISKKIHALHMAVCKNIKENTWNIKNGNLILDMLIWIKSYIIDDNIRDLSKLTRLKCMVHKGEPIYSMEDTNDW